MRRIPRLRSVLSIGLLASLPAILRAATPAYDSPAAVISAAEDLYGNQNYKGFVDCFDDSGVKLQIQTAIPLLVVYTQLTPDGHGKQCKECLARHGVTDLAKHGDEADDAFAVRLANQLTDPRGFLVEATPLESNFDHVKPMKGTLTKLKIDGDKATASYDVRVGKARPYTQSEDMTFTRANGSWRISSAMDFAETVD